MSKTVAILLIVFVFNSIASAGGNWSVDWKNAIELKAGAASIEELSGVTLLSSPAPGSASFLAVSDEDGNVVQFDATLDQSGLTSAAATAAWQIDDTSLDTEGITFHPDSPGSVFISYERDTSIGPVIPGLRQYDFSGNRLQSVSLPAVWTTNGNTRTNRGFESHTRSIFGNTAWVANEEALAIDGDTATATTGTTVRLQRFSVDGSNFSATQQFAYNVEPVHGAMPERSGLVDLMALPDGDLLALERSAAFEVPVFLTRIFQIGFDGATDISSIVFNDGLAGETYVPVTKTLLWSGAADVPLGANLEGLAFGPQLANGNWTLVGVADNGGGDTGNLVVAFELTPPAAYGDFNRDAVFDCSDINALNAEIVSGTNSLAFDLNADGIVNLYDQEAWLAAAGAARDLNGPILPGDANLDGAVDGLDFVIWSTRKFSAAQDWCQADFNADGSVDGRDFLMWNANKSVSTQFTLVPEPAGLGLLIWLAATLLVDRNKRCLGG